MRTRRSAYLTITDFARQQGVTRAAVHQWMQATPGFTPYRVGGIVLLSPADRRRILARPRKPMGRPKKTT